MTASVIFNNNINFINSLFIYLFSRMRATADIGSIPYSIRAMATNTGALQVWTQNNNI